MCELTDKGYYLITDYGAASEIVGSETVLVEEFQYRDKMQLRLEKYVCRLEGEHNVLQEIIASLTKMEKELSSSSYELNRESIVRLIHNNVQIWKDYKDSLQ